MNRIKVGIIGTGNIGTDLLIKVLKSDYLDCGIFAGHNPSSKGIRIAEELGVATTFESIHYIEEHPDCCEIVFDATSARAHLYHAPILKSLGKYVIDLTPAQVGRFCVPVLNLEEILQTDNVNMITCGGQAMVPIAAAITGVHPDTKYLEIVATIASRSAGTGTRANIDEFTQTTRNALTDFTGVKNAKAIIVLNPAEPPLTMRNTLYALIDNPDMPRIGEAVRSMEKRIRQYVPGYSVTVGPVLEDGRVITTVQVIGSGDYLPAYAGNLDIITCASVKVAEEYAKKIGGEGK